MTFLIWLCISFSSNSYATSFLTLHMDSSVQQAALHHPFQVRLILSIPSGWHIYGPNPNQGGLPTQIQWQVPNGVRLQSVQWPPVTPFVFGGISSHGYSDSVSVVATFEIEKPVSDTIQIGANATWLMCKESCIPGSGSARTVIKVGKDVMSNSQFSSTKNRTDFQKLSLYIGLAFLGGLILNLMPCVLPVITLKVLHFVAIAQKHGRTPLGHSLAFTLGILTMFWVLAGLLLALRQTGHALGWGFQLQSPWMIGSLMGLFLVVALWMLGLFEAGHSLSGLSALIPRSESRVSSFLSGLLVTLVATPCTAPFMGTALGVALVLNPMESLAIFTSLGLGVAAPYLVLSANPNWLKWMPKPGKWMITLKKAFGVLMLGTVLWLGWVLWVQVSAEHFFYTPRRFASPLSRGEWVAYDPTVIENALQNGRPVFIDFTAKWCLSCQVNHQTTLSNSRVLKAFHKKNVLLVRADWTTQNPIITQAISSYGRSGVPVYVYYPPHSRAPIVLPEVLTPGVVLGVL